MYPQPALYGLNFSEQWRNGKITGNKVRVVYLQELVLLSLLNASLPKRSYENESDTDIETLLDTSTDKELFYLAAVTVTLSQHHSSSDSCFNKQEFRSLEELKRIPRIKYEKASKAFNSVHDLVVFAYRRCKFIFKPKLRTLNTNRDVFNFYKRVFEGAYKALTLWYGKDFEDLQVKSLLSVLMKQQESKTLYRLMPDS
jgi:hypothetical protein